MYILNEDLLIFKSLQGWNSQPCTMITRLDPPANVLSPRKACKRLLPVGVWIADTVEADIEVCDSVTIKVDDTSVIAWRDCRDSVPGFLGLILFESSIDSEFVYSSIDLRDP